MVGNNYKNLEPLLKKHIVYGVYNHESQPIRSKLPPEIVILYTCLDEREVSKEEIFEPPRLALYHTPHHLIRTNQAVQKRTQARILVVLLRVNS